MNDDTPWLNEQEDRLWRAFLEATVRINVQLSESLKARTGLTLDDYEVLVHLSEADPQRIRMTELSSRLLHSQSRLSQRVDRLAKRGLVRREKCSEDGRGTFAVLSDEGLRILTEAAPDHVRDVRSSLVGLIEESERAVVVEVLERLAVASRE